MDKKLKEEGVIIEKTFVRERRPQPSAAPELEAAEGNDTGGQKR